MCQYLFPWTIQHIVKLLLWLKLVCYVFDTNFYVMFPLNQNNTTWCQNMGIPHNLEKMDLLLII